MVADDLAKHSTKASANMVLVSSPEGFIYMCSALHKMCTKFHSVVLFLVISCVSTMKQNNTKRQENSLGRRREAPMSPANTRAVSLTTLPFLCSELAWHCHTKTSHQTSTWLALFCILLWVVMDKLQGPVSILKYLSKYSYSFIMKRPSYIYNGNPRTGKTASLYWDAPMAPIY